MDVAILNMSLDANKGDLAIVESTLALVRSAYPEARVALFNHDYSPEEVADPSAFLFVKRLDFDRLFGSPFPRVHAGDSPIRENTRAAARLLVSFWALLLIFVLRRRALPLLPSSYRPLAAWIAGSSLVILKGGSYFYSHGGCKQFLFLYRMFLMTLFALALGKKIIALGHSVGPLNGRLARLLASAVLGRFHRLAAREEITRDFLLHQLRLRPEQVTLISDLAFLDIPPRADGRSPSDPRGDPPLRELAALPSPRIGITVRHWRFPGRDNPGEAYRSYLRAVADFTVRAASELSATCVFMPHAQEDIPVAEEAARLATGTRNIVLGGDYHPHELRRLYGAMDLFVATRIHSGIFALTAGTPVVAIAYEVPKGYGIIGMIEGTDYVLGINSVTSEKLLEKAKEILSERERMRKRIGDKVAAAASELETQAPLLLKASLSN
jgi:colanic acid/amylovoran biosynthesis protein